ncbi:MAG: radical SAM family heme chaperone HemW, partial [Bacteroidetes bacterium]
MPTIYVHIPFCRKACYYCDFHFSTNFTQKTAMINAINKEIVLQKDYFSEKNSISSIYFGGGTPSVLSQTELESVLKNIYNNFEVDPQAEITLEANPDDLNKNKLKELKSLGINRLSIGVQSFDEAFLKYMNRSHNAKQSLECLENAQKIGFDNLSFDLIYGVPAQNHDFWKKDLQMASQIGAKHISAYCLTIEEKTVFGKWLKNKKINEINDDFANDQFDMLVENLENKGYQHYEISNFAMPNHYSKHNTNYWKKGSYLGIGASAHSYNQQNRQFNISNNSLYIKQIEKG